MAVQGTPLVAPLEIVAESIEGQAYGDLIVPFEAVAPNFITANFTNRFPTPPIAWGFLEDVLELEYEFGGLDAPYIIIGALYPPDNPYLEPRTGQIWPR